MMGHLERLKGGGEWDVFTRWRRYCCYLKKSGAVKYVKRKFNRRIRRDVKAELKEADRA